MAAKIGSESMTGSIREALVSTDANRKRDRLLDLLLARQRSEERAHNTILPRASGDAFAPLSFAQQRLWFLAQLERSSEAYHIPLALHLQGRLDGGSLRRALDRLVWRHEVLRTSFVIRDGEAFQHIGPADQGFALACHNLSTLPDAEAQLDELIMQEAAAPFELEQGPLIRGRLVRLDAEEHVLLLTMHHIVSDGWSGGVLTRELSALYQSYVEGGEDPLKPLTVQYADYAVWQRRWLSGEVLEAQSAYWREKLTGAPTLLELPSDRKRPARQEYAGGTVPVKLDGELTAGLKALSRRYGMTLFMTVLAGWALVLSRLSGQDDIVIGTPSANRSRPEIEGLIGFFVNTLALRIDLSGQPTVEQLLRRVQTVALGAQAHQDLPFEQVVELVGPARSLAHTPLFQAVFAWQNMDEGSFDFPGIVWRYREMQRDLAKFDLSLVLTEVSDGLAGKLEYARALFDQGTVERLRGYLLRALEEIVRAPLASVAGLDILPAQERRCLLVEWNDTTRPWPRDRCVHQLFEAQVSRNPGAKAVTMGARSLSYGELNACANRLAHHLRQFGVGPDERVAICMARSPEMVVGVLAVLKAGGAYVPLDPTYPTERLALMLADSAPVAVLSHAATREPLTAALSAWAVAPPTIDLDTDAPQWAALPASNLALEGLTSRHLAYVTYTSGSTGVPNGVMVEHHSVTHLVIDNPYASLTSEDCVAHWSNISFDASTWEIWAPLLNGSRMCLIPQSILLDPVALCHALHAGEATAAFMTAALLNQYADALATVLPRMNYLLFGGEQTQIHSIRRAFERNSPRHFVHVYGPTETTTYATAHEIRAVAEDASTLPIGRPIARVQIYILDAHGRPVPIGVAGEIYIGGEGVARGYLNRPELTQERFLENPFVAGERLYKTGDLGRFLPDGNVEFLGRNDFQVKLRGLRIELGEIEARLVAHPEIRSAVVVAREDTPGDKRLVAYYTAAEKLEPGALREHLAATLPDYMVPAAFMCLEGLPLNPNGKVDRKALPAPEGSAFALAVYQPPQGAVEESLAAIWSEALGVVRVGRHDNFFELGGHSLLAVRVISRIRKALNVEVPLASFFMHQTLAALTRHLAECAVTVVAPLVPIVREARLPLSFAQQRLWFLAQLEGGSTAYHIPLALRLRGRLDEGSLGRALDRLVWRHEVLRTSFVTRDGEAFQHIGPADQGFALAFHDLGAQADAQGQLDELMAQEAWSPFDLEHGPLFRGRLIRLGAEEQVLLLTLHHIVSDGWSMGVLTRELSALYRSYVEGGEDPLEPLTIQYADYATWQRRWLSGEVLEAQSSYWREKLAGAPTLLELPSDRKRPARQDYAGSTVPVEWDEKLTAGLKALSRRYGMTLFMTVLAGWALVLSRLSGQDDIVIGAPSANRSRSEIEGLIGFFVNALALRIDLSGQPTVEQLLRRVQAVALGAQAHQDLPFEQVVELVRPARSLAHTPIFQAVLTWQNNDHGEIALGDLAVDGVPGLVSKEQFDISLDMWEQDGRILGKLSYATTLFEAATMERHGAYLRRALAEMVRAPQSGVAGLDILPAQERRRLLVEWNDTDQAYPQDLCVHQLIEAQVAQRAEAIAVILGEQTLSYGELNARANRLAHHLRRLGVEPDARVGICVERSLAMVVGVLAVLKSGGAYVPLDPTYPAERLALMLADSTPLVILTHTPARDVLNTALGGLGETPVLDLERDAHLWANLSGSDPDSRAAGLTSRHLAYVMYTSGSTGKPKGVMIEHRSVVALCGTYQKVYGLKEDLAHLQMASLSFDVFTGDLIRALSFGGKLVICPRQVLLDTPTLVELMQRQRIAVAEFVPVTLRAIVDHLESTGQRLSFMQTLLCGSDLWPAEDARSLRALCGSAVRTINTYGVTESTIDSTCYTFEGTDIATVTAVPIGRPFINSRAYILDANRMPVPQGVVGELYLGGVCVARGYFNRPDLTRERFIESPFVAGERLYKTGDLARHLPDGNIVFLGRNDFQVKLRGFRVELGEIEARLLKHPDVREAVVVARGDPSNDQRLVAYYTAAETLDPRALREHLAAALMDYMVPAAFMRLERLPLTPNGKLDRKALPAPESDAYASAAYEPPRGVLEESIARIWKDVLSLDRIGRNDGFFELGGHSLLAVRVVSRVRKEIDARVDLMELLTGPTLAQFASYTGVLLAYSQPEEGFAFESERGGVL